MSKNVTQGGGFCEWDEENKRYYFSENPPQGFSIGDFVPEEWGIQDVNLVDYSVEEDEELSDGLY